MDETVIVAALRDRRQQLGLTQREVADLAGVHFSTVHRMETGSTSPNLVGAVRIAAALGYRLTLVDYPTGG